MIGRQTPVQDGEGNIVTAAMQDVAHIDHPQAPAGPPKLGPRQLRTAQEETLGTPRLHYSRMARTLFKITDLAYGRQGSIVKFVMLEFIARVPYQEYMSYVAGHGHDERIHKLDSLVNLTGRSAR
jgi:hypothetical protein